MGLTNSQLDQVMREYDRRQLADQADQTARIRYAMEKVPGLRELDQAVSGSFRGAQPRALRRPDGGCGAPGAAAEGSEGAESGSPGFGRASRGFYE